MIFNKILRLNIKKNGQKKEKNSSHNWKEQSNQIRYVGKGFQVFLNYNRVITHTGAFWWKKNFLNL